MTDNALNVLEKLAADLASLTENDSPAHVADVFFRGGAVLCTTALHIHPDAHNYLAVRVIDDASGRALTVHAAWVDGVSPLHKLEVFEQVIQALAADGDEAAIGALARVRAQPGRGHAGDVEQLRAAALMEGQAGDDRLEHLRERLPSAGPIVDALAEEVVRLTRGIALLEREHAEAKPLARMLLAGLSATDAERAYSSCWKTSETQE